jgi:uncharacterized protein YndB with AHSA1/START domain
VRSVIEQTVTLPAPASVLFAMYLDAAAHAEFTGHHVVIGREPGSEFRAFDGKLTGSTLAVISPRLIVQSWRSVAFHENDPDSTLILSFEAEGDEGRIDLVHVDVPEHDYKGVAEGWPKFYWEPWRRYLEDR